MKKIILISAMTGLVLANSAVADASDIAVEAKQSGVIMGSFITGAATGGPLGAIAGMLAGAWLGDQVKEAGRVEAVEKQLVAANHQITSLSQQLAQSEKSSKQFAQIALDQLQLELLFKTGDSQLTSSGQRRMAYLADFLRSNPELHIQLEGYADPRGDADLNLALSRQRVKTVASLLQDEGIEPHRIAAHSYGASRSLAAVGDHDSYAMERVVKIKLTKGNEQGTYAQVNIKR